MDANKIRRVRELRGYSQAYMACALGIEQSTYSRIERGAIRVYPERMARIAEVLGVQVDDLTGRDPLMMVIERGTEALGPTPRQVGTDVIPGHFMQQLTDRLGQVIADQQELLKELQRDRTRMLELMERMGRRPGRG